jgi:hypothetical protein
MPVYSCVGSIFVGLPTYHAHNWAMHIMAAGGDCRAPTQAHPFAQCSTVGHHQETCIRLALMICSME